MGRGVTEWHLYAILLKNYTGEMIKLLGHFYDTHPLTRYLLTLNIGYLAPLFL